MADWAGAVAAIEARLSANWNTTSIAMENEAPPSLTSGGKPIPFVRCEVDATGSGIRGVGRPGNHVVVDDGLISVIIFVPTGSGRSLARQYAVTIGEIYRVKQFYDSDPGACVRTWTPQIDRGQPATSENPKGQWWAVTVTIPFEFYHRA